MASPRAKIEEGKTARKIRRATASAILELKDAQGQPLSRDIAITLWDWLGIIMEEFAHDPGLLVKWFNVLMRNFKEEGLI